MLELLAAFIKGLTYATALSGVGAVLARTTLQKQTGQHPALHLLIRSAGALVAICAVASAALVIARLGSSLDRELLEVVFLSPLGAALLSQALGGACLAFVGERRASLAGAILILLAFGIVGHSATQGLLTSASVVLHVSAAAWWLGGLFLLLLLSNRLPAIQFADLASRFSRQATWVVAMLVGAALVTASVLLDFKFDWSKAYTSGLLVKFGLTIALLALAGVNRIILVPRLTGESRTLPRLRAMIVAEIALFACILSVTAWLTTWQSPRDLAGTQPQTAVIEGPIGIVEPWAPAMFTGAETAAGYMTIVNTQQVDDRLLAVSSPWAGNVNLHMSEFAGDVSSMRELDGVAIPAGGRIVLEPGARHVMFTDLVIPFAEGDDVPITLHFEIAGQVESLLKVYAFADLPEHGH